MSDPGKAVFLSYASQDMEAAKRICDALRAAGVEVWFDQSELVGGDAWDQKIRKQIKECALFMPVISEATEARAEGYFRIEWRLADRRMEAMGKAKTFLLPVCIDETRDAHADVPDSFQAVQWTRVPDGEPSSVFVARVKKLLESPGAVAGVADSGRSPASPRPAASNRPRLLMPVIAGAAVAVLALVLSRPWLKPGIPAASASVPETDAGRLVERARKLTNSMSPTVEDLKLAATFTDRAIALEPENAEAWAVAAELDAWHLLFRFDNSPARIEQASTRSLRALKLEPRSFDARWSRAAVLMFMGNQPEFLREGEKMCQELVSERPADRRALSLMATCRDLQQRHSEAGDLFVRARHFVAAAWSYMKARSYDQAEQAARDAIEQQPSVENFEGLAAIQFRAREDLDAAQATMDRIPASDLLNDHPVSMAWSIRMLRREPDLALAAIQRVPRDWLASSEFTGPKTLLVAQAHELAGRPEAAGTQWRAALQLIERHLATEGNTPPLLQSKATILAQLGQFEEARQVRELERQLSGVGSEDVAGRILPLALKLNETEEVIRRLETELPKTSSVVTGFHAYVRYSSIFDPLRGNPRFEKLLRDTLPKGAKPFEDQKTTDQGPATTQSSGARPQTQDPGPSNPVAPDSKSVAVLAFANLSDDKANEYFSDGISEELLNQLGKVPGLRVAGRTSSFSFKGRNVPEAEVAGKLGVAYVVTGSVQKSGSQVRITARLVKAADGFQVWSEKFTRDLKDIFAVQDEIAGLIAQNLQLKLVATDRAKQVVNPEAYRLTLEGRYFWNQRNEEGFARAEAAFAKAVELDPRFAPARSGLAGVSVIRAQYRLLDGIRPDPADTARARSEALRAIELDPTLAEPHAVLGYGLLIERGRLRETEEEFQRALALNPNDPVVRCWHATVLATAGHGEAALAEFEKAIELDPLWFINLQIYAWELANYRRSGEALEILTRSASLRAEVFIPSKGRSARLLAELGRKEEALAAARYVRQHPEIHPRWDGDAIAILTLRQLGEQREAAEFAEEVLRRLPADNYLRGHVFAAIGRFEEAWPYLQQTPGAINRTLFWDQLWDPMRDDPRWAALMVRLECVEEYKRARESLAKVRGGAGK